MQKKNHIKVQIGKLSQLFPPGVSLEQVLDSMPKSEFPVVAAYVNGHLQELHYRLVANSKVKWVDTTQQLGVRIYRRSQRLLLLAAHDNLFPERELSIHHSLENGTYWESNGEEPFSDAMREALEQEMTKLIEGETPIQRFWAFVEDAKRFYRQRKDSDHEELLSTGSRTKIPFCEISHSLEVYHGLMVPNCRFLPCFALEPFDQGFILRAPNCASPKEVPAYVSVEKIGHLFNNSDRWAEIQGVSTISQLNKVIETGKIRDLIELGEGFHSQSIYKICDEILADIGNIRLILIAGPSSSGKTTFSHRLSTQFRINGIEPLTIAMDNYFVDREKNVRDAWGNYDFESIEALDLDLFGQHLKALIRGETVDTPVYDFHAGKRLARTKPMRMYKDQILIIEGIHGLNPDITPGIAKKNKRHIYISALTQLKIDSYNPISSSDNRLLRRMTRDMQFRGTSPVETITRWASVQRGEEKNIFPYQENADFFFNSSLIYEFAALKPLILPHLEQVETALPVYYNARWLVDFLDYILPIPADYVPNNSLLREFIGGSIFTE